MNSGKKRRDKQGLSPDETKLLSTLSSQGKSIIKIKDIQKTLGCSYQNARRIASDLADKKWLERLESGKYLIIPLEAGEKGEFTEHEFIIASDLVEPYYIGFFSALNFHGFTEQVPYTVFVATTKQKASLDLHGLEYHFVTLTETKFFGAKEYAIGNKRVQISTPEKTLIDSLDHLEHSGGLEEVSKVFNNLGEDFSFDRLVNYALKFGNGAVLKRLNYFLHLFESDLEDQLQAKLKDDMTEGYPLLDPTKPDRGPYKQKWKLRLNVSEKQLLDWGGIR
ncbi:transcriptional regulator [Candidatus Bipolaricaulota bacterium]|nr:transcriptional regulator [Candidatus Bipolaricaulota bacterium]